VQERVHGHTLATYLYTHPQPHTYTDTHNIYSRSSTTRSLKGAHMHLRMLHTLFFSLSPSHKDTLHPPSCTCGAIDINIRPVNELST